MDLVSAMERSSLPVKFLKLVSVLKEGSSHRSVAGLVQPHKRLTPTARICFLAESMSTPAWTVSG
jgi:hypothetical protein